MIATHYTKKDVMEVLAMGNWAVYAPLSLSPVERWRSVTERKSWSKGSFRSVTFHHFWNGTRYVTFQPKMELVT